MSTSTLTLQFDGFARQAGLRVATRDEWEAKPMRGSRFLHPDRVHGIEVHHTADDRHELGPLGWVAWEQDYHQNSKGWADIFYAFLVAPGGLVIEGRGLYRGVGSDTLDGDGDGWYLPVCFLGDFSRSVPTFEATDAYRRLRWVLARTHPKLDPLRQRTHRTARPGDRHPGRPVGKGLTACPGHADTVIGALPWAPPGWGTIPRPPVPEAIGDDDMTPTGCYLDPSDGACFVAWGPYVRHVGPTELADLGLVPKALYDPADVNPDVELSSAEQPPEVAQGVAEAYRLRRRAYRGE